MRHVTSEAIGHADGEVMEHLEGCARCRSLVVVDVDLVGVRHRILDEVTSVSLTDRRPDLGGLRRGSSRWWCGARFGVVLGSRRPPLNYRIRLLRRMPG